MPPCVRTRSLQLWKRIDPAQGMVSILACGNVCALPWRKVLDLTGECYWTSTPPMPSPRIEHLAQIMITGRIMARIEYFRGISMIGSYSLVRLCENKNYLHDEICILTFQSPHEVQESARLICHFNLSNECLSRARCPVNIPEKKTGTNELPCLIWWKPLSSANSRDIFT
jgi:hypothetical protein